jgi:predicted Zn-dependent protease with MMP-like domain
MMECNIGLLSEFEKKHPNAVTTNYNKFIMQEDLIMGVASLKRNELWVFIDRIAFLGLSEKSTIEMIIRTTIHELIHLCGVSNEYMARLGEKMVRIK